MKMKNILYQIVTVMLLGCILIYQALFPFGIAYGAEVDFPPGWFGADGIMDYHLMNFPDVIKPRAGFTLLNTNTNESQSANKGFFYVRPWRPRPHHPEGFGRR